MFCGFTPDAPNLRMQPIIQLDQFTKTYHTGEIEVRAVRGVTLTVMPGEFVAIMGASGSGKSTMMNTIGCLDRPSDGKYLLDGVDVGELGRDDLADLRNENIGFVFQGFNLLSRTSAVETVELPLLYSRSRMRSGEQRERSMESLTLVGLGDRSDHHPNQLSGGQQQRVAIARRLSTVQSCCWLMNPQATWTARRASRSWGFSRS